MTKKKWALLLLCLLLLAGYFKLFYKTYSEKVVAKSADCIAAIDIKRIVNTIIWNTITTPGQWKKPSFFSSDKDKISWRDMVKMPDYIFVFHSASHPFNAWYTVLEIKDAEDFNKGLQQYSFEKEGDLYTSKQLGIIFLRNGDSLLVGNLAIENKNYIRETARELFVKKEHCNREVLEQNVQAASHLSVQLKMDDPTNDNQFIIANFDKEKITVTSSLPEKFNINLVGNSFTYNDSSLCTLAFTQPHSKYTDIHSLLPDSAWLKVSKAINFNIDSLLLPTNTSYQLDIEGIHSRVDSAVSYTYDDNFNPVKKVIANMVEEPSFNFIVRGNDIKSVYNYWKQNDKLEATAAGELFTPMPFVKSYCSTKKENELVVTSFNYKALPQKKSVQGILFFRLLFTKIPPSLIKYLPDLVARATQNIESVEVMVNNEKSAVVARASFNKKKNDLPLIEW